MKVTSLALFFDELRRQDITFDVNNLQGSTFKDFFGAYGDTTADVERNGVFLAVYVQKNSLCEDLFNKYKEEYLQHCTEWLYKSPYENEDELMYIIEIIDEK